MTYHNHILSHPSSSRHRPSRAARPPAVRTYRRIADILAACEGHRISRSRVAKICRVAEVKIARALLADPVVRERFRAGTELEADGSAVARNPARERLPPWQAAPIIVAISLTCWIVLFALARGAWHLIHMVG